MRTVPPTSNIGEDRLRELDAFVSGQRGTERVLRDLEALGLELADIVQMDEFTLDLVVPLPDGLTLVYDTT
ncbi:MAG: hypothetical protein ABMA64_32355 [Myxococcota bacterium]